MLIDLFGLAKVIVEGQSNSIIQDIENMVCSYIEKPRSIRMVISPMNQDITREVDPSSERTFGILTKKTL